jgi:transposase-like protein
MGCRMNQLSCKVCSGNIIVKNGFVRGMQRYRCKGCGENFVYGDKRLETKYKLETKNLVVKMYLNNCGFRRIAAILEIPLTTVFSWIKRAGEIVDQMVKERKHEKESIEVLEMDELYTYIKKKSVKHEYGLLLIGTDSKMLRLK